MSSTLRRCPLWAQPDNAKLNASYLPKVGGNWNNASNAGAFILNVNNSTTNTNANIGAHLIPHDCIDLLYKS